MLNKQITFCSVKMAALGKKWSLELKSCAKKGDISAVLSDVLVCVVQLRSCVVLCPLMEMHGNLINGDWIQNQIQFHDSSFQIPITIKDSLTTVKFSTKYSAK